MVETTYMQLVLPDVSVTLGPEWAEVLNDAIIRADAHTHEEGYGVRITQNGLNITGDLSFGGAGGTNMKLVGFTGQSSDPSTSYKPAMYSKLVGSVYELHYIDSAGSVVRLTNTGSVYGGSVTANKYPTSVVTLDTVVAAGTTFSHYAVDASVSNRTITLPLANDVESGRFFYVSDYMGSCSSTRTITIARSGSDTFNGGATSVSINKAYGFALVVRTSATTWRVLYDSSLASTTAIGQLMLTNNLGGTAYAPTVLHITGTGASGYSEMAMQTLRFDDTILNPVIKQDETAGATGQTLTISAQTAATDGGDLILASGEGSGAATHGDVLIKAFDTEVLAAISGTSPYLRVSGAGGILFGSGLTSPTISQEALTATGSGQSLQITAQSAETSGDGGSIFLNAGTSGTDGIDNGGNIALTAGTSQAGGPGGEVTIATGLGPGTGTSVKLLSKDNVMVQAAEVDTTANMVLALCAEVDSTKMPVNTGNFVVYIGNAGTAPTADPVGGCIVWSDGGVFSIRNSNGNRINFLGTTTTIAPVNGGAGATPASPDTYIRITHNGTTYRIPAYRN